jgi:preprotein translocase subunit SecE
MKNITKLRMKKTKRFIGYSFIYIIIIILVPSLFGWLIYVIVGNKSFGSSVKVFIGLILFHISLYFIDFFSGKIKNKKGDD